MNSPHLKTIRAFVYDDVATPSRVEAQAAVRALADALLKAQTELSFYARTAADYSNDEHDEIVERASGYLCDDHGQGAEQALAALGMECLSADACSDDYEPGGIDENT